MHYKSTILSSKNYLQREGFESRLSSERKPEVLVKYEIKYRKKIKIKRLTLEFSDYKLYDENVKIKDFSIEYFSTNVAFSTEILMDEVDFAMTENEDFGSRSTST